MGRGRRQETRGNLRQNVTEKRADLLLQRQEPALRHEGRVLKEYLIAEKLVQGSRDEALRPYRQRWNDVLDSLPGRNRLHRVWESLWGEPPYQLARWAESLAELQSSTPSERALRDYLQKRNGEFPYPPSLEEQAYQLCLVEGVRAVQADPRLQEWDSELREAESSLRQEISSRKRAPLFLLPHSGWYAMSSEAAPDPRSSSPGVYSRDRNAAFVFGDQDALQQCLGQGDSSALLYAARHELIHSNQPHNMDEIVDDTENPRLLGQSREMVEGLTESLNQSLGQRQVNRPPYRQEVAAFLAVFGQQPREVLERWNSQTLSETAAELHRDLPGLLNSWSLAMRPNRGPGH